MTKEEQSKVTDAFKKVYDRIAELIGNDTTETRSIKHIEESVELLFDSAIRGDMKRQKDHSTEIAATAFLYMVKFL